jgi:hypothetical protein
VLSLLRLVTPEGTRRLPFSLVKKAVLFMVSFLMEDPVDTLTAFIERTELSA